MLQSSGFDLWADGYDRSVSLCDDSNEYPFAGYRRVLGDIYSRIRAASYTSMLDIGFGTGVLTRRLYSDGLAVTGLDFSPRMLSTAREYMPAAELILHDFSSGLPPVLSGRRFDCIISTYALHHLTDAQKYAFLPALIERLNPGGALLIGDIAFPDRAALDACRTACGADWDSDEYYFVLSELRAALPFPVEFTSLSFCAGTLLFLKEK